MTGDISGTIDDWFAVGEDCAKITLDTTQDLRYTRVKEAQHTTSEDTMTKDGAVYRDEQGATWKAIRTGAGRVTGYIEVFFCRSHEMYVTVPGASRWMEV
jgi:hypothetical protein